MKFFNNHFLQSQRRIDNIIARRTTYIPVYFGWRESREGETTVRGRDIEMEGQRRGRDSEQNLNKN
jgi:hypothetical protein